MQKSSKDSIYLQCVGLRRRRFFQAVHLVFIPRKDYTLVIRKSDCYYPSNSSTSPFLFLSLQLVT